MSLQSVAFALSKGRGYRMTTLSATPDESRFRLAERQTLRIRLEFAAPQSDKNAVVTFHHTTRTSDGSWTTGSIVQHYTIIGHREVVVFSAPATGTYLMSAISSSGEQVKACFEIRGLRPGQYVSLADTIPEAELEVIEYWVGG